MTSRRRAIILVNACIMTFMGTLDGSIVNIALPEIVGSLHVGIESVQWVVSSYLIAISATLLIWGRLADLHGRKRFFAAGLAIFTLGSLLCGLSGDLTFLVLSRVLQALGASMAMALVQGIVTAIYPPAERGKALGFIGAVVSIGSLLGPSIGGVLVHFVGWRSIFFVNVPVGLIGVALTFAVMPESKKQEGDFDYPGAAIFGTMIVLFFVWPLALQEGRVPPAVSVAAPLAIAALALGFYLVERKRLHPLIDRSLFASPVFTLGIIAAWFSYVAMFAYIFFMPFYLLGVRGLSALEAGLMLSIYPVTTAILAPLSGALSDRVGYKPLTVSGLGITALGLALISTLRPDSPLVLIGVLIALLGVGGAVFQSPNNSSIMGAVPRDRLGVAGSLNSFFRNVGMVSGTTLAVALFSLSTRTNIESYAPGGMDKALFMRGFAFVSLFAAFTALAGSLVNLLRLRLKREREQA
jgi:EmrB/QacA subfamily drug resistance transporter